MPADPNLLTPQLAARSLSKEEIVLSFEDVLAAIEQLCSQNVAVSCWEGWILSEDGKHGHPPGRVIGSVEVERKNGQPWKDFVDNCRHAVLETIKKENDEWLAEHGESYPHLYFCLSVLTENE